MGTAAACPFFMSEQLKQFQGSRGDVSTNVCISKD